MIEFMFLALPHCALDIFETRTCANCRGEYGLDIPANFHFFGPEKVIKLAKKWNNKNHRKHKRNCKTL